MAPFHALTALRAHPRTMHHRRGVDSPSMRHRRGAVRPLILLGIIFTATLLTTFTNTMQYTFARVRRPLIGRTQV